MVSPQSISKFIQLLLLHCFLASILDLAHADPPYGLCPNTTNYAVTSQFQNNLNNLLHSLSSNASHTKFYNTSSGNDPDRVYALFLCYNFVIIEDCKKCIDTASQDIQKLCPNTNESIVWEEMCQLHLSNENFFGHLDVTENKYQENPMNISEPEKFRSVVNDILGKLAKRAAFDPSTGMYATGEVPFMKNDRLYAFVQCTTDLSPDGCKRCLETAITNISSFSYFSRGARLLSRSCYLRYELYPFYIVPAEPPRSTKNKATEESGERKTWMIIIITIVLACLLVVLVSSCVYSLAVRNQSNKEENEMESQEAQLNPNNTNFQHQNFQGRNNMTPQESPFIDLETILAATNFFSDSNKLGQGGFGPVYKGILSDGKEVAVKRLSINSEQGSEEFINEVLLIMKLQHKNLVKLLGFCLEGEEKMLVYEYMPNRSLDVVLFDPRKREQLNWSRRLNIISGLARGILYLHEDSRLKIIHRDLKPGNVLLDCDLNPKISDFGMARIFGGNEGQANTTTIVGTYGYMAPEYAMEGLYSIKSDVFSFGVLLLEIMSGRRNAGFHLSKHAPSLLVYAWQLWNEGKGLDLMDPLLTDSCSPDEFLRCMHIGLLCVQEDAFDRPTMSSVIVTLKTETVSLRQPERPAFSVGRFTDHNETGANDCSANSLTISNILPR